MARIGAKLQGEIKKATRRYNTIVNRYNRQNPDKPKIANITNKQIMTSGMKADEIRLQIKLMNILQSETDFVAPGKGALTTYERAQLDYLRKRQATDLKRKLNKALKEKAAKILAGDINEAANANLEIVKLQGEIANLKREPKTDASARRQLERAKRRQQNKAKYGNYEAPPWAEVTKDHFLAAMSKASLDNVTEGQAAMRAIEAMTNEEFAEFLQLNPYMNLELVYDTKSQVADRARQVLTAVQFWQSSTGRPQAESEETYEDTDERDDFWYG